MIPAPTAQKAVRQVLNPSADTSNQHETDVAATDFVYDSCARTWGRKLGEIESSGINAFPAPDIWRGKVLKERPERHACALISRSAPAISQRQVSE